MDNEKINVTQSLFSPLEEFLKCLEEIWKNKCLTNYGIYHEKLEEKLKQVLQVPYISLFTSGTQALLTALKALEIKGEVITTPYSFVATSHVLQWSGIQPVFVDIQLDTCNIDPDKIERAITSKTTAILAVHVYGNPCETDKIQKIANKYQLKVIYDAAHAFGVEKNGISILKAGDLSI